MTSGTPAATAASNWNSTAGFEASGFQPTVQASGFEPAVQNGAAAAYVQQEMRAKAQEMVDDKLDELGDVEEKFMDKLFEKFPCLAALYVRMHYVSLTADWAAMLLAVVEPVMAYVEQNTKIDGGWDEERQEWNEDTSVDFIMDTISGFVLFAALYHTLLMFSVIKLGRSSWDSEDFSKMSRGLRWGCVLVFVAYIYALTQMADPSDIGRLTAPMREVLFLSWLLPCVLEMLIQWSQCNFCGGSEADCECSDGIYILCPWLHLLGCGVDHSDPNTIEKERQAINLVKDLPMSALMYWQGIANGEQLEASRAIMLTSIAVSVGVSVLIKGARVSMKC